MSDQPHPRLESADLDAWMVRLFDAIEERNLPWLTALSQACEHALGDALIDLVPSYTTLLVVFDPLCLTSGDARQQLVGLLAELMPDDAAAEGELQEQPTWYDPSVGPDPARITAAALKPYSIKTRSNARKLRR